MNIRKGKTVILTYLLFAFFINTNYLIVFTNYKLISPIKFLISRKFFKIYLIYEKLYED